MNDAVIDPAESGLVVPAGSCRMKTCSKCGKEKSLACFNQHSGHSDGLSSQCKTCSRIQAKDWQQKNPEKKAVCDRRLYQANKEKYAKRNRIWRQANKKKQTECNRRWARENPEKTAEIKRNWKRDNKAKVRAAERQRRKLKYETDESYRLLAVCRARVHHALRGTSKIQKTMELVGCSLVYLNVWLELQFKDGMSWDNYGMWQIDHIKPCASFDFTDLTQQKKCFHYTNLQPLWANENIEKGAKWKTP